MWNKSSSWINLIDTYNYYNKHYKAIIDIKNTKRKLPLSKLSNLKLENKYKVIKKREMHNENKKLFNNLNKIHKRNHIWDEKYVRFKRIITNNKKSFLERKVKKINFQNKSNFKRLRNIKSNYSLNDWENTYKKNEYLKKNIINKKRKIGSNILKIDFPLKYLTLNHRSYSAIKKKKPK